MSDLGFEFSKGLSNAFGEEKDGFLIGEGALKGTHITPESFALIEKANKAKFDTSKIGSNRETEAKKALNGAIIVGNGGTVDDDGNVVEKFDADALKKVKK